MTSIPSTSTTLTLEALNQPLTLQTKPVPKDIPTGTALIRVLATTVRSHYRAGFQGRKTVPFTTPFVGGISGVGRILAVGPDAVTLQPGQLIWVNGFVVARDDPEGTQFLLGLSDLGMPKSAKLMKAWPGMWSDVATLPLENCIPLNEDVLCNKLGYSVPDLEYIERLSVANGGVSAANLRAGETVVVCPATGHYSGAVAELAAQIGCHVIALSRSASKLEPLTSRHKNITALELKGDAEADTAAIRALCPNGAADAMIDTSPPTATANSKHLTSALNSIRSYGRAVFLGAMGEVTVPYMYLMSRNITIRGQWMYSRSQLSDLLKMIEAGVVKLGKEAGHEVVNGGYKFEQWDEALKAAEASGFWGQHTVFLP